jgi:muramidase (phage lysozyme)
MQRGWLYAVGRYQFIPRTLRFAIDSSSVSYSDKFTPEVQDRLMAALVLYKRPIILSYLQGSHDNIGAALRALAREWASVEYSYGRGYYDHVGGNRAHITRVEAAKVLRSIKKTWQERGALP